MEEIQIPHKELAIIAYWGTKVGQTAVNEAVAQIKKVGGDLPALHGLIEIWSHDVVDPLVRAKEHLGRAGSDIDFSWTGTAAGKYKEYLAAMVKASDEFINISAGLSFNVLGVTKYLLDIRAAIKNQYKALHKIILEVAAILIEAQGEAIRAVSDGLGGAGTDLLESIGVIESVTTALGKFIRAYQDFFEAVVDATTDISSALVGIQSVVGRLVIPEPSDNQSNKKYWTPVP